MIKYLCDICDKEVSDKDYNRIRENIKLESGQNLIIEIYTGLEATMNTGNFHHVCILKKLTEHFIEKNK